MIHEHLRCFNTMGRWPNQTIVNDVSLMVRATGRSLFLGRLPGFDLEGKFHGKGDPAAVYNTVAPTWRVRRRPAVPRLGTQWHRR